MLGSLQGQYRRYFFGPTIVEEIIIMFRYGLNSLVRVNC